MTESGGTECFRTENYPSGGYSEAADGTPPRGSYNLLNYNLAGSIVGLVCFKTDVISSTLIEPDINSDKVKLTPARPTRKPTTVFRTDEQTLKK
jgi:hypothetical protein